jgi:hypothetical protein
MLCGRCFLEPGGLVLRMMSQVASTTNTVKASPITSRIRLFLRFLSLVFIGQISEKSLGNLNSPALVLRNANRCHAEGLRQGI